MSVLNDHLGQLIRSVFPSTARETALYLQTHGDILVSGNTEEFCSAQISRMPVQCSFLCKVTWDFLPI